MDLKRLRTFVTVAEHGTVSKAAAVLNITQPALSRQIGSLEYEFSLWATATAAAQLRLPQQICQT